MRALWETVVEPLLEAYRPTSLVELGGLDEELYELLDELVHGWGGEVHRVEAETTLDLREPDFALISGQPNWYFVTEALSRLDEIARGSGAPFPVTLVHGVDWPTGRRDAYPEPAAVPVAARQPHAPDAGVERAIDAHDRRNGVLTAVEDFLASARDLELVHLPGLGGTAILVPSERLRGKGSRGLASHLKDLRLHPPALAHVAAIEADRVRTILQLEELAAELETARAGVAAQASAEREALRERADELVARVAELQELLARSEARLTALEPS
jgi:hypothetical protein